MTQSRLARRGSCAVLRPIGPGRAGRDRRGHPGNRVPGTEPAKIGDRTSVPDGPRDHDQLMAGTAAHGDRIAGTVTTAHRGPTGGPVPEETAAQRAFRAGPQSAPSDGDRPRTSPFQSPSGTATVQGTGRSP